MEMKYAVMKVEDINKYLNDVNIYLLLQLFHMVDQGRRGDGKQDNSYIVINTDESYVPEVIEIMKRHGHWED